MRQKTSSMTLMLCSNLHMFNYILDTPLVFDRLHLHKILDPQKTRKLLKGQEFQQFLSQHTAAAAKPELHFFLCDGHLDALDAIEKIHKMQEKDPHIIDAISALESCVSVRTYSLLLTQMGSDRWLSSEMVNTYKVLGELYDRLRLWYHGTLTESLLGLVEEKKEEVLDHDFFIEKFKTLYVHQQYFFQFVLDENIKQAEKDKSEKVAALQFLLAALKDIQLK